MVENGIKPAYVFDGKPPDLKAGVVSTMFRWLKVYPFSSKSSCRSDLSVEKRQRRKERRPRRPVRHEFVTSRSPTD